MKKGVFILFMVLGISCATSEKSGLLPEDELFVTRKYVGNFIDYKHTGPISFGSPHIIWIKTTRDTVYGKISAYSQSCKFARGDRLYLRRVYQSPGFFGYWMYQIENENDVWYKISEFQHDNKVLVQTWFWKKVLRIKNKALKAIYQITSEEFGTVMLRKRKIAKALCWWLNENGFTYKSTYSFKWISLTNLSIKVHPLIKDICLNWGGL